MYRRTILCPMTRPSRASTPRCGLPTPGAGFGSEPTLKPRTTGTWKLPYPAKKFFSTISSWCEREGGSHLVWPQPTVKSTVWSSINIPIKNCKCTFDWPSSSDHMIQASHMILKNYVINLKCLPVGDIWKQEQTVHKRAKWSTNRNRQTDGKTET